MRIDNCDISQALHSAIRLFKLDKKLKNENKKKEKSKNKDIIITEKGAFEKKEKKYIKAGDLGKAIKYFHHIKFLFTLMGDKMDFTIPPTEEDVKHITQINSLIHDRIEQKEIKKSSVEVAKETYQDFKDFMTDGVE